MDSLMAGMLLMGEMIACIDDKKILYSNKMISSSQDQVMHIPWAVKMWHSYLGNGTDHPRDLTITLTKLPGKQDPYI